jgi:hypothetical protein
LQEWNRTDITYTQKVADLQTGGTGTLNGAFTLTASTVQNDGKSDELRGGNATDLFFAALGHKKHADDLDNVQPGETIISI